MAEVIWTHGALSDLDAIRAYIHQFNPLAAQRMALRLISAGLSLDDAPQRGRAISQNRRELTVAWPYLIRYRIAGPKVYVLEIRHGARQP